MGKNTDVFEVNKTYSTEDWFCGGCVYYTVVSRTDTTITVSETSDITLAENATIEGTQTFEIKIDSYGAVDTEYVLLSEYKGHEHRLYSKQY
jgi:hypothetical protein